MTVEENLTDEITVIDSEEFEGETTVTDDQTNETGKVIARLPEGKLLVEWEDADESDAHQELELFSIYADNVTLIRQDETGEVEVVENPFGGWLAGKGTGRLKRRKATRAFGKRLKAETGLDRAKEREKEALEAYRS